jgi:ribosomal protein L35
LHNLKISATILGRTEFKLPKIKSSKTCAKRLVITGNGRVKFGKVGNQHNALAASKRRKAKTSMLKLDHSNLRAMRHLLPYGGIK